MANVLRRHFHSSIPVLEKLLKKPWAESLQRVLALESVPESFRNREQLRSLEPYGLSDSFKDLMQNADLSTNQRVQIHNKLIEELTQFDFAVAAMHLKELQHISGSLSLPAFIQVLENNPGRVKSTWEYFKENFDTVKTSDDALVSVLNRLVNFDPIDVRDGKKVMTVTDVARSVHILSLVKDKSKISVELWTKLVNNIILSHTSAVLPQIFEVMPSSHNISELPEDLTQLQVYGLHTHRDLNNLFEADQDKFMRLFSIVGTHNEIPVTEQETQAYEAFVKEFNYVAESLKFPSKDLMTINIPTEMIFEEIVTFIKKTEIDKSHLAYAKMLLRYLGMHKGDTKRALEFYHEYIMAHPSHSEELMYEVFLSFAYQSFVHSNDKFLKVAETLIPSDSYDDHQLNVLRCLVLVNSKFNPDRSLDLFNKNIQILSKEKNPITNTSDAALLCEDLILAFLRNKDRDFSHVIFEGAAREKIIDGPTAVKRVKNILTLYGESIEEENCTEIMDKEIERVLKSL
ncbi:unnamed protein product [Kluyveromyces dobzhanskii CBS 2104]|uniref:WGS project CCBQ000000000 data, contig 00102 n=1 Tax=Kluyveromyces dobzhanskii CBS 2104 TaxID=1427455 RepID=A0A0A8L651_9SACH|nr:unnamed protein product [Kluyveromyces dobzhanskii CBS 2104]